MALVQSLVATREVVRSKINLSFNDDSTTQKIETSIYKYTTSHAKTLKIPLLWSNINLRRIYTRKARSVIFNINAIKEMIVNAKLQAEQVAFISCYDMRPDIYEPLFEKQKQKEIMTLLVDKEDEDEYESPLSCPTCNSNNVRYTMYQCRAGDEGSNIFYRCLACGANNVIKD